MPDNEENNNTTDTENNNTDNQQSTTQGGGGGHIFAFGMDSNAQGDMDNVEKMKSTLENCGNKVYFTQIGPNQETYLPAKAKEVGADTCIFACLVAPATIWSFGEAVKAGTLPHTIFAIEGWMAQANSLEDVRNTPWEPEHDAGQFMTGSSTSQMESEAKTVGEYIDNNSQHISICYGSSPEELAQNICSGTCGNGGGSSNVSSTTSGGASIKDKTFEDCIKRICAATDSVFLVENNAAVLFPYTDWMAFTLRQKISQIKAKDMDSDLFEIEYNTDGFYNKVTVVWGADEETDHQKQDQQLKEEREKKGNVTTVQKSMPIGGTQISEQYDPLVEIYGELEKKVTTNFPNEETAHFVMNALLIQYIRDFNNSCRCRVINNQKFVGGTFYAVENPNTNKSELFYLNSYSMFKDKKQPLTTDMEFKYGPEGAEELLDYQSYGGGSGNTNNTGSSTEQQIWEGAKIPCHQWTCGELRTSESDTTDPQIAEDYYNKMNQSGQKFCFTCYGMSSWLYYQFNNKANIPCRVIGNSEHHVVEIYKNNAWYKPIDEYRQIDKGYHYNDFCKGNAPVILDAPNAPAGNSTNANPSGNTADQTNNTENA